MQSSGVLHVPFDFYVKITYSCTRHSSWNDNVTPRSWTGCSQNFFVFVCRFDFGLNTNALQFRVHRQKQFSHF